MTYMLISSSLCVIIPLIILMLANILYTRSSNDREKTSPFECGFDPMNSARIPFSTRFFLLAVIFIVFDIEIVLLIPIPLIMMSSSKTILLLTTSTFLIILILGLFHEWMEGSLNWST